MTINTQITAPQTVMRSLMIGVGGLASTILDRFEKQLRKSEATLPTEAIMIRSWEDENPLDPADCLEQISNRAIRDQLLQKGWQLTQPENLAFFILVDWDEPSRAETVLSIFQIFRATAQKRYGVNLIPLLILLFPSEKGGSDLKTGGDRKTLLKLPQKFSRGLFALSRVNSEGLCLSGIDEMVSKGIALCQAWTIAPLQQLPEWLDSQSVVADSEIKTKGEPILLHTAGISEWIWDPVAMKQKLLSSWAISILHCWLSDRVAPYPFTSRLFTHTSWIRSEWQKSFAQPVRYRWVPPMPWRLRPTATPFMREDFDPIKHYLLAKGLIKQEHDNLTDDLHAMALECLNQNGKGMIYQLIFRLEKFEKELCSLKSSVDERIAMFKGRYEQQISHFEANRELLQSKLEDWPKPGLRTWLSLLFSPRLWANLIRIYIFVHRTCQTQEQVALTSQQLASDLVTEQMLETLISAVLDSNKRLAEKVSEIYEMLGSILKQFEGTPSEEEQPPLIEKQLLKLSDKQLVAHFESRYPADSLLDANRLLKKIGGFGQMIDALDNRPIENVLQAEGNEHFRELEQLSGAELLEQLYPTRSELLRWWSVHIDDGTPLWRTQETELTEHQRLAVLDNRMTAICGYGLERIQSLLKISNSAHVRWIESEQRNRITILRAGSSTVEV